MYMRDSSGKTKDRPWHRLHKRCRELRAGYERFSLHFQGRISYIFRCYGVLTNICSFVCLCVLVVMVGFDHNQAARHAIDVSLRAIQCIILAGIVLNLVFNLPAYSRSTRLLHWIMDIAMLMTLLPLLYPHPEHPWLPWLEQLLYSSRYLYFILGIYSLVDGCSSLMRLLSRRVNPSLLLGGTFLLFIIAGSLVLMMPRCLHHPISYTDSFFVSTSAISITGLTPVDIPSTFTALGQIVICILLQVGGIGIITFTSFFAIFYSGSQSIYNQLLIRDIVYTKSMSDLVPTVVTILCFTLFIEAVGAVAIYFTLPAELGLSTDERLLTAIFHSTSSFCNAGFSIIPDGMSNTALLHGNQGIYIVTSIMILAGAIGFPILVNIRQIALARIKHFFFRLSGHKTQTQRVHLAILNTRLALVTTMIILVVSTVAFFVIESPNSMRGMSLYERVVQSVFNSLTPRSAGFVSIPVSSFMPLTLIFVMAQMWIGGASQSMSGGIKVNTVAMLILNLRSIITGRRNVYAYDRRIATPSVRRANAVMTLSILFTFVVTCCLMALEPDARPIELVFESISAVFTVGSSFGITPELCDTSKYILSAAMFVGRVGLVSLLSGMFVSARDPSSYYPPEIIVIN